MALADRKRRQQTEQASSESLHSSMNHTLEVCSRCNAGKCRRRENQLQEFSWRAPTIRSRQLLYESLRLLSVFPPSSSGLGRRRSGREMTWRGLRPCNLSRFCAKDCFTTVFRLLPVFLRFLCSLYRCFWLSWGEFGHGFWLLTARFGG